MHTFRAEERALCYYYSSLVGRRPILAKLVGWYWKLFYKRKIKDAYVSNEFGYQKEADTLFTIQFYADVKYQPLGYQSNIANDWLNKYAKK